MPYGAGTRRFGRIPLGNRRTRIVSISTRKSKTGLRVCWAAAFRNPFRGGSSRAFLGAVRVMNQLWSHNAFQTGEPSVSDTLLSPVRVNALNLISLLLVPCIFLMNCLIISKQMHNVNV